MQLHRASLQNTTTSREGNECVRRRLLARTLLRIHQQSSTGRAYSTDPDWGSACNEHRASLLLESERVALCVCVRVFLSTRASSLLLSAEFNRLYCARASLGKHLQASLAPRHKYKIDNSNEISGSTLPRLEAKRAESKTHQKNTQTHKGRLSLYCWASSPLLKVKLSPHLQFHLGCLHDSTRAQFSLLASPLLHLWLVARLPRICLNSIYRSRRTICTLFLPEHRNRTKRPKRLQ